MKVSKNGFAKSFAIVIMVSLILVSNLAKAGGDLKLPSEPVRIEVFNGAESTFEIKLMDVPRGCDIANGMYHGWCVDRGADIERSPVIHSVLLYSSLNPPGELAGEEWDMVNYILNHKQGRAVKAIQEAIWYFVDLNGSYIPTRQDAWDIIDDALANGDGFVPRYGQTMAVICYPTLLLLPGEYPIQITIIEVVNLKGPESTPTPTPTPQPTPEPTPMPSPTPTPTPTATPAPTPTPKPTPTQTPGPTPTPSPAPTPTPTLSPTPTSSPSPVPSPLPTPSPTLSPLPTQPTESALNPLTFIALLIIVVATSVFAVAIYKRKKPSA
jgi:type VI secretion system secreted protein VgrG